MKAKDSIRKSIRDHIFKGYRANPEYKTVFVPPSIVPTELTEEEVKSDSEPKGIKAYIKSLSWDDIQLIRTEAVNLTVYPDREASLSEFDSFCYKIAYISHRLYCDGEDGGLVRVLDDADIEDYVDGHGLDNDTINLFYDFILEKSKGSASTTQGMQDAVDGKKTT